MIGRDREKFEPQARRYSNRLEGWSLRFRRPSWDEGRLLWLANFRVSFQDAGTAAKGTFETVQSPFIGFYRLSVDASGEMSGALRPQCPTDLEWPFRFFPLYFGFSRFSVKGPFGGRKSKREAA